MSFVVPTKTLMIEALQSVFDGEFPHEDFRDLWISMEYPLEEADYPGIWVDFRVAGTVQNAGIGHKEYTEPSDDSEVRLVSRWRFAGNLTLTIVALTSLQRDRLLDEVVALIAFGLENPATSEFRKMIERNDLIALSGQWDRFDVGGTAETPGTPWGTDEVIYETTVSMDFTGEFVSKGSQTTLVPLASIDLSVRRTDEEDPSEPQGEPTSPAVDPDNAEWH